MLLSGSIFLITFIVLIIDKIPRTIVAITGAVAMLVFGIMDIKEAMTYVSWETIGLLFGMFSLVAMLSEAGFFQFLALWVAEKLNYKAAAIFIVFPLLSAFLAAFIDSITVAGRLCFQWCKGQPQAYSEKTGKPDSRGAYGLMGQEMIGWLTHLQHTRRKNVWFVGILNEALDDFNRRVFSLQIDGSKTGLELPGIVDEVITLAEIKGDDGSSYRAFICQTLNTWGYPAKDRSGRLDLIEEPHLGRLMEKIAAPGRPALDRLDFARPATAAVEPSLNANVSQES